MEQPLNSDQNHGGIGAEVPSFPMFRRYTLELAVIFSAVITSFLLILAIFKCFSRSYEYPSRHGEDQERDQAQAHRDRNHREEELAAIPVITYGATTNLPSSSMSSIEGMNCSVCLAEFEDSYEVRVLPRCRHMFHRECIDQWLFRSLHCPNCRDQTIELSMELPGISGSINGADGNNTSASNL